MSTLPPLPVGDVSVYFEGQRIGKAHSADQMRVYATAALSAQAAEVEALRADAERYRWLRDASVPPHNFYLSVPIEFDGVRYTPQDVDAAIDAARAALKERAPNAQVTGQPKAGPG